MIPEPAPTPAQPTRWLRDNLWSINPLPARIDTAMPEAINGRRFHHPENRPISVNDAPAASAAINVPGPIEPHGPIISPNNVSKAARYGVNPNDSKSGSPISSGIPKPVTVSRNGTTP